MGLMQQIQSGRVHTPPRIMTYGTEGIGKAQPLDAKVLTPTGFVAMGDLHTGDLVIGSDGKSHRILGVYPQGQREVYRVEFRDGSATECCDNHLWFTQTRCERDQKLSGDSPQINGHSPDAPLRDSFQSRCATRGSSRIQLTGQSITD